MPILLCVHIHLFSSDWETPLSVSKVSVNFLCALLVYLCLSSGDLFIFSVNLSPFYSYLFISSSFLHSSLHVHIYFWTSLWYSDNQLFIILILLLPLMHEKLIIHFCVFPAIVSSCTYIFLNFSMKYWQLLFIILILLLPLMHEKLIIYFCVFPAIVSPCTYIFLNFSMKY